MKKRFSLVSLLALSLLVACQGPATSTGSQTSESNNSESNVEVQKFVVTFMVDGVASTLEVEEGGKAAKPADPEKADYIFTGWFTDELCENAYDFNSEVNGSFTLYAGFEEDVSKKEWTVTFDLNGGTLDANLTQTIKNGMTVSEPTDPTKDGYKFVGWFTELTGGVEYDFSTPVYANDTIYAVYEEIIVEALYNITASSQASLSNQANCAADGNADTYWKAANGEAQSLIIDLEEVKAVNKVSQEFADLATWDFEIQGSIDGEKYYTLLDNNASGTKYEAEVNGYYRYIKLAVAASDVVATSKEFSVEATSLGEGTNVAYGMKGATCCHAGGCEIEKIFDGIYDNYHCANSYHENHYMGADFTTYYYVTSIELYFVDATDHKFFVDYADTTGAWPQLATGDYTANTESIGYVKIPVNKEVKAILVHHMGNSTGNWPALKEMKVNGFKNTTASATSTIVDNKEVYDLGETSYVGRLEVADKSGTNRVIETSLNGTDWTAVDMSNLEGEHVVVNKEARYVRFSDDRATLPQGNLRIYSLGYKRNLALGATATSTQPSTDPAYGTAMMLFNPDCNQAAGRFYCSNGYAALDEITVDLGNVCVVESIAYKWQDPSDTPVFNLKIEVSVDSENWTTIYDTATLEGGLASGQVLVGTTTPETENVRYVKITAQHTAGWTNCNSLTILGYGSN